MKILRVSTFLDYGGIESKMIKLSKTKDNNEWLFCAIGKGGVAAREIKKNKKRVVILNQKVKIFNFKTLFEVIRLFRKESPDIVHSSGAEANFYSFLGCKILQIPILTEEIGIPNHHKLAKLIFKFIYRNSDFVIGESTLVVEYLKNVYHTPIEKTKVVSNFGIFSNQIARKQESEKFTITTVSRLEPVKNLSAVLRVVKRLNYELNEDVQLNILGDGSLMGQLVALSESLGLGDHVLFTGFIKDPTEHLLQSNLYLLNSISEGFSNSLIEAMGLKTPSLSTRVGSAEEIIKDGQNGWLVDVDELKLYRKLKSIIHLTVEERNIIGQNGFKTITENYGLNNHLKALHKLYESSIR